MSLFTGTVSLFQLESLYLAVPVSDTLMIGQSSEIVASNESDRTIGYFEYANADLPAYYLNDKLTPDKYDLSLKVSQFCIGLRTTKEADYFVLLCKNFEQVDVSDQTNNMQLLPGFMCNEKMLVKGVLEYKNQVYLITNPDMIFDYIISAGTNHEQERRDAR